MWIPQWEVIKYGHLSRRGLRNVGDIVKVMNNVKGCHKQRQKMSGIISKNVRIMSMKVRMTSKICILIPTVNWVSIRLCAETVLSDIQNIIHESYTSVICDLTEKIGNDD